MGRLLLAHDGTLASSDLFKSVLTMIDPQVVLDLVAIAPAEPSPSNGADAVQQDYELATHLGRELRVCPRDAELGPGLVNLARDGGYDLIILALPAEQPVGTVGPHAEWIDYVLQHAHCPVFLAAHPVIPKEIEQ